MNFTPIIGFILTVATLWFTVIRDSPNPEALLEWKGMALVIGGTLSAGLVIFPFSKLLDLERFIVFGVIFKRRHKMQHLVREIVEASGLYRTQPPALHLVSASHPFLKEGLKLVSEGKLDDSDLREVMTRRSQYFKQSYLDDAKTLTTMAKFPSAFGMLGSTVGLIDMMSNLGKNGHEGIGPAMAMALVATFWGLVFTYMIFMPLSDYAIRMTHEDNLMRQLILEGVILVKRQEEPSIILDKLNGFLSVTKRLSITAPGLTEEYWKRELAGEKQRKKRSG